MTRRREDDQSSIPEAQPLQAGRHNWPFGGRPGQVWKIGLLDGSKNS